MELVAFIVAIALLALIIAGAPRKPKGFMRHDEVIHRRPENGRSK